MRLILDTNVLVSGIFFGGIPGRILTAWAHGAVELVLSPAILDEYQRVGVELASRYPERAEALEPVFALLAMHSATVDAPPLPEPVSADPADDIFFAAALASRTPLIVSGDRHLLAVAEWHGIVVLSPRQFVDRHLAP